jgi:hypothetical protein
MTRWEVPTAQALSVSLSEPAPAQDLTGSFLCRAKAVLPGGHIGPGPLAVGSNSRPVGSAARTRTCRPMHDHRSRSWVLLKEPTSSPLDAPSTTDLAFCLHGPRRTGPGGDGSGQARRTEPRGAKIADLLIVAAAEAAGLVVLHYDNDFDLIANHRTANRVDRASRNCSVTAPQ